MVFLWKRNEWKTSEKSTASGYKQCDGDYEIYVPVVDMLTIWLLFLLCIEKNLYINQLDVKCAFLNGDL